MRRLLMIVIVLTLFQTGPASGQLVKIAHTRINEIVNRLPELQNITLDTVGTQYVKDSIYPHFDSLQNEYRQILLNIMNEADHFRKKPKEESSQRLEAIEMELSNAEKRVAVIMQAKQVEFLRPYYQKVKAVIVTIAKQKGYTHVLSTDNLLFAMSADNITNDVLAALNIRL